MKDLYTKIIKWGEFMNGSDGNSYITIMMVTFFAMVFIVTVFDKRFNISALLRKRFNIDKRSKIMLFTLVVIIVFYIIPLLVFRFDSLIRAIFAGITIGIASGMSNRFQSLIVRNNPH